jgi:hypothetical protein
VRAWAVNEGLADDYDRFERLVRQHGWRGPFEGRNWTYLDVGGHSYWCMGVVINRKPVDRVPGDHGRR